MVYILAVDDGSIIDHVIVGHLGSAKHQLTFVSDPSQVQSALNTGVHDLLLLNVELDRQDICLWTRSNPRLVLMPIICVSRQDDLGQRLRYFQMGVDDFLVTPFDGRELVARIETVVRRAQPKTNLPKLLYAAGGDVALDVQRQVITVNGTDFALTRLEYLVLYHLMRVAGKSMSTEELLETVWGYRDGTGDPALVRAQIKNLRRKISPASQESHWLRTMPGLGYQIVA